MSTSRKLQSSRQTNLNINRHVLNHRLDVGRVKCTERIWRRREEEGELASVMDCSH